MTGKVELALETFWNIGDEEWTCVDATSTEEITWICIPPDGDGGMRPKRRGGNRGGGGSYLLLAGLWGFVSETPSSYPCISGPISQSSPHCTISPLHFHCCQQVTVFTSPNIFLFATYAETLLEKIIFTGCDGRAAELQLRLFFYFQSHSYFLNSRAANSQTH